MKLLSKGKKERLNMRTRQEAGRPSRRKQPTDEMKTIVFSYSIKL